MVSLGKHTITDDLLASVVLAIALFVPAYQNTDTRVQMAAVFATSKSRSANKQTKSSSVIAVASRVHATHKEGMSGQTGAAFAMQVGFLAGSVG